MPATFNTQDRRCNGRIYSTNPGFEKAFMGEDFGARDPTPGEIGSNFGEKIVMNWDTEHIIKPPDAIGEHIGLGSRQCQDVAGLQLLDEQLRERLRQQVPGWRINNNKEGLQCIRQEWTAKDGAAAQQLVAKLQEIAQQHGHALSHAEAISSTVIAEITTPAKGGLTENDFIIADRINSTDLTEMLAKRKARFWA
jgi:4a-hydroxytetrahydrobiopterin dehydratase